MIKIIEVFECVERFRIIVFVVEVFGVYVVFAVIIFPPGSFFLGFGGFFVQKGIVSAVKFVVVNQHVNKDKECVVKRIEKFFFGFVILGVYAIIIGEFFDE